MEPTVFSEGFTLKDLMNSRGFTLTADSDMQPRVFDVEEDFLDEEGEEILASSNYGMFDKHMEVPKYHSFDDLAKTMEDVEPTGAVKISIIEESSGPLVPSDGYVVIHYASYWENEETPFDNTMAWNKGEPIRLRMGYGAIMPGLEIGLSAVHGPTAKFRLLLSPEAMCGKLGALPRIRPERALYCVCLVSVEDIGLVDRFTSLPSEEQKKFAVTLKTVEASNAHANTLFSSGKFDKAITSYFMSLEVLNLSQSESEEEMENIKQLMCKVYTNLAVCYTKLDRPKKVLLMCENLARIKPITDNAKALYLNGKAEVKLGEYEEGLKYLKMALKLQPQNEDIAREMAELDKKILKTKMQEKQMWKGAFKTETNEKFSVSEDFKEEISRVLSELSLREGHVEFKLPRRTSEEELGYLKSALGGYSDLKLLQDTVGKESKYKIIKTD